MKVRSGFTLLMVLLLTVLVTVAVTGVLSHRSDAFRRWAVARDGQVLSDLLLSTEVRIVLWLDRKADQVVLPPQGGGLLWQCDRIGTAHGIVTVQVDLYDRLAMVAPHADEIRQVLGFAPPGPVPSDPYVWYMQRPSGQTSGQRMFPGVLPANPIEWGGIPSGSFAGQPAPIGTSPSWATVINPWSDGRLNINTAPVLLLTDRFRRLDLVGIEVLLENRKNGVWSQPPPQAGENPQETVVASSDRWAARVHLGVGRQQADWWCVIDQTPSGFKVVRRYVADY